MGQDLCKEYNMPHDISTAVLIVKEKDESKGVAYKNADSILRLLLFLTFPWNILGKIGLLVPQVVSDFGYRAFARNRGDIWKMVKRLTGMGDTVMVEYKDRIVGVGDVSQTPESWGLHPKKTQ